MVAAGGKPDAAAAERVRQPAQSRAAKAWHHEMTMVREKSPGGHATPFCLGLRRPWRARRARKASARRRRFAFLMWELLGGGSDGRRAWEARGAARRRHRRPGEWVAAQPAVRIKGGMQDRPNLPSGCS